jgi:chromosome partitioning protein
MAKVISIINLKGGVAKTTTAVQLAECLCSEFGKKVLVIDLDPQTNATIALISEDQWERLDNDGQTLFHLFNDRLEKTSLFSLERALQEGVSNLRLPSLHLLASSIRFIDIQDRLSDIAERSGYAINPMEVLKTAVHNRLRDYGYVLIDCPPNLGFITRNGIEISDFYLIPTIPDTLSAYGIPQIVKTIHGFANARPLKIRPLGLLITKYDSRSDAHKRGMASLPVRFRRIFDELGMPAAPVFDTRMPQANTTAEAMDFGENPGTFRAKYGRSRSGDRYLYEYVIDLAKEFMSHVGA